MSSSDVQNALIAALLPSNHFVRKQMVEELEAAVAEKFNSNKGPQTLMLSAAESVIISRLRNSELRKNVFEVSKDFRVLFENLPALIQSPDLALHRLREELFSDPIEWMRIQVGKTSIHIWNRYQLFLSSKRLGSEQEAVTLAHKFLMLAVEKRLNSISICFTDLTDEELMKTATEFLAASEKAINNMMESTGSTYVASSPFYMADVNTYYGNTFHFNKMTLAQADIFKWENKEPVDW